jgi:uncharacterized OsmC-like protein
MTDTVTWVMSEDTIVRKVETQPEQQTIPDPSLKRVKEGERMDFHAHVNVEMLPQGKHLKKATVFSNVPNGGTWEVISDEGKAVGGRGTAPSPLMYFAVGLGLCMMSHAEMLANQHDLELHNMRLEQRFAFSTTLDLGGIHPKDVFGRGERAEMNLLFESSEPQERLAEFTRWCAQACMAYQTVTQATPGDVQFYINGQPADTVDVPTGR